MSALEVKKKFKTHFKGKVLYRTGRVKCNDGGLARGYRYIKIKSNDENKELDDFLERELLLLEARNSNVDE